MAPRDQDLPHTHVRAIRTSTKANAVYQEVRRLIIEGGLEPGSTLNQEVLASDLGLSVTPLREALRGLEAEGLLRLSAHRTITITPLTLSEVEDLYAVRLRLDPWAAGLAAQHASDEALENAARLAAATIETSAGEALGLNREFHRAVYSAAGNEVLTKTLDQLWTQTDRYRFILLSDDDDAQEAALEHLEITKALQSRDRAGVAKLTKDHVERALALIRQVAGD
jgi:DNA-binding GntR family transcriptional regulator